MVSVRNVAPLTWGGIIGNVFRQKSEYVLDESPH